jgi:hypothetical protein
VAEPATDYDEAVYSPMSVLEYAADGTSSWRRQTWREIGEEREQEIERLRKFERMVVDLDRNANGRHEGDIDSGEPGGVSLGNLRFLTGSVIGYDIGGRPYVVPPRGERHDPAAWGAR